MHTTPLLKLYDGTCLLDATRQKILPRGGPGHAGEARRTRRHQSHHPQEHLCEHVNLLLEKDNRLERNRT